MKVSVNDVELFSLSEVQKKVLQNDICCHDLEADLKRRLEYILLHKYEQCFKRLKEEWEPKLAQRYESIPTNPDAFAQLVFEQADYKDRLAKNQEVVDE